MLTSLSLKTKNKDIYRYIKTSSGQLQNKCHLQNIVRIEGLMSQKDVEKLFRVCIFISQMMVIVSL